MGTFEKLLSSERGIALAISLIIMMIVMLLGAAVGYSSRGARTVGTSLKNQQSAFEIAVAGLERGREEVRRTVFNNNESDYSARLAAAADGGTLVDPSLRVNFNGTTGVTNATSPLNAPLVASTNLDGSSYQVFLNNDVGEGATTITDANGQIKLTAFATGPNGVGFSVVQADYRSDMLSGFPDLPAGLTMPGPDVVIDPMNSNAAYTSGDGGDVNSCYPAVGVTTTVAEERVEDAIPNNREDHYTTCDPLGGPALIAPDSIENFLNSTSVPNPYDGSTGHDPLLVEGDINLTSVDYLQNIVNQLTAVADFTSINDPGFSLGSPLRPKIVVINGDLDVNPSAGPYGGILVVTGKLTIGGSTSYTGTIFALGTGWLHRNGGGNGTFCGGVLVANMVSGTSPDGRDGAAVINGVNRVGVPRYEHNGGGVSFQAPSSAACERAFNANQSRFGRPMDRLAFQQLR